MNSWSQNFCKFINKNRLIECIDLDVGTKNFFENIYDIPYAQVPVDRDAEIIVKSWIKNAKFVPILPYVM